jgi:hypothetical protein
MKKLGTLAPVPKVDETWIRDYFPPDAKTHSGRMRVALARDFLRWASIGRDDVVCDPLMGCGSTALAAYLVGAKFEGCERATRYHYVAHQMRCKFFEEDGGDFRDSGYMHRGDARHTGKFKLPAFNCGLWSPPFPNAKPQGKGKKQQEILEAKSTYAGNEFDFMEEWRTEKAYKKSLREILRVWMPNFEIGAPIGIHCKQFVKGGEIVRTDKWTADAMRSSGFVDLLGYLVVPLVSPGHWHEFGGASDKPLRDVLESEWRYSDDMRVDYLSCGHKKLRKKGEHETEQARCVDCDATDMPQIREEMIIVGERSW